MPVTVKELADSRPLSLGGGSPQLTAKYVAFGSQDEGEVLAAVLLLTPATYQGLWRQAAKLDPQGGGVWYADVDYSIPTDGTNQPELPDQSEEGEQTEQPEPSDSEPLGPEWSFSIGGGTRHITESRFVLAVYGADAPDFGNSINVTKDGVEGVDIQAPQFEFTYSRKVASINAKYLRLLAEYTGTVNNGTFKGFQRGELLFTGVDPQYKPGDGWSITYKFSAKFNRTDNIDLGDIVVTGGMRGWDVLSVAYADRSDPASGRMVKVPIGAYKHVVYQYKNFKKLGI